MSGMPNCARCGRFTTGAAAEPVRDPIHPYTADYAYYCARCADERKEQDDA